jgi:lipopolysaccharide/colanic/teichoic acid biosynthesis glycosyltransferase
VLEEVGTPVERGFSGVSAGTRTRRAASAYVTVGKRLVDVLFGTLLLFFALPVIVVLAIVSSVTLKAWPFFVQARVGRDGRHFRFPKIRTLPKTAAAAADKHEIASIPLPRWCALLRKTHLDELPQLVCVVTARMSLVGPRPEMPELLVRYPHAFAERRGAVRPGCTGLWQISVAHAGMIYDGQEYDEFYIERASLGLDIWILWRTVLASLSSRYEIRLDDLPSWTSRESSVPALAPRVMLATAGEPDIDLTALEAIDVIEESSSNVT